MKAQDQINCMNCEKLIVRKTKTQKYCCVCNGVVSRKNNRERLYSKRHNENNLHS